MKYKAKCNNFIFIADWILKDICGFKIFILIKFCFILFHFVILSK